MTKAIAIIFIFTLGLPSIIFPQPRPCDKSNRGNKAILFWLFFTRYKQINALFYRKHKVTYSWGRMFFNVYFRAGIFVDIMPFLKYDMWEMLVIMFKDK